MWCTGNVLSLLSLRCVGLAIGLSTWGATNLLAGWLIGKFGIIVTKEEIPRPVVNLLGVLVAVGATFAYAAIKPMLEKKDDASLDPAVSALLSSSSMTRAAGGGPAGEESALFEVSLASPAAPGINAVSPESSLLPSQTTPPNSSNSPGSSSFSSRSYHDVDKNALFRGPTTRTTSLGGNPETGDGKDFIDAMDPTLRRIVGVLAALLAGLLFGINFAPPIWYIDHHKDSGASADLIDYVFAHFAGIFFCSLFYFLCYAAYKRNQPVIIPELVIPAFISGTLWAIAQASWFVATTQLGLVVAYPLVASGPSLVGSLWGALVFREIRGSRNVVLLFVASILLVISATLITLSRS